MKNNPLISVVIPTFNREDTISYCLNSVLAQTYKNLETVVVDDCSTDNTVNVINSHSDPRVRCIVLEQNSGAQAARNRGIKEAKGEWIAFQDSDDEWLPEKLERQVAALDAVKYDPLVVVHSNAYRFDNRTKKKDIWMLPTIEGDNQYPTLLKTSGPLYQTMLVSRTALEKIGFLDEDVPSHQEWDTSIRLAKYCKFVHIKEALFIYHVGNSSAISGDRSRDIEGWNYIISKHKDDVKRYCGEEAWLGLIVKLLRRCLNSGAKESYDNNRSRLHLSDKDLFVMVYLILCKKLGLRPDNVLSRLLAMVYRSSRRFHYDER